MGIKRSSRVILVVLLASVAVACLGLSMLRGGSVVRELALRSGLLSDSNTQEVLQRMQRLARYGSYDQAIAVGVKWTSRHPSDGTNDEVFLAIGSVYLSWAKRDQSNREQHIAQALIYRDKALPIASDAMGGWYSMAALGNMANLSEKAADLSERQRCVQYHNAMKLLGRISEQLQQKQAELRYRTPSTEDEFGVTTDTMRRLSEKNQSEIARVTAKQARAECR